MPKLRSGVEDVARDPTQRLRLGVLVGGTGVGETTPRRLVEEVMQAIESGQLVVSIEERPALQGAIGTFAITDLRDVVPRTPLRSHPAQSRKPDVQSQQSEPDCDFDGVGLEFKRKTKPGEDVLRKFTSLTLRWRDGVAHSDLPQPESMEPIAVPVLEMTATSDPEQGGRTIGISVVGGPGYACALHHPRIVVHPLEGERLEHEGAQQVAFVAVCRDAGAASTAAGGLAVLRSCHFASESVNRYYVVVDACGHRRDGAPARGHVAQEILVYPADEWKLELTIPFVEPLKHTWKKLPDDKWKEVKRAAAGENQPKPVHDEHVGSSWSLKVDPPKRSAAKRERPTVKLSRTKSAVASEVELDLAWVTAFVDLENAVKDLFEKVAGGDTQLGYRLSVVTKVLEGSLSYAWGFRESADRRVYRWWRLEAKLTWIDLEIELSWGFIFSIWGFRIEAVVYGAIAGKWAWSIAAESTPDRKQGVVTDHWEIPGRAGVRATLGPDWLAARGEVITGVKLDNTVTWGDEPIKVDCKAVFTGMKATLRGEVKLCGVFASRQHAWVWMDPKTLIPAEADADGLGARGS
jgi:hypothetical protein